MKLAENIGNNSLLLIDGHSLTYRAFYAMPNLSSSNGLKTGALTGFLNMLLKFIDELKPEYLAFAFDLSRPTKRLELFPEYKANRQKMPEDLEKQFEYIYELLDILKIPVISVEGYEADDCIGTIAKDASSKGIDVNIISSDRDLIQVISENINLLCPNNTGKTLIVHDIDYVQEKYGFSPKFIVDFKALAGDKSDGIPGAKGVGDKTAVKLISEFGTAEDILANVDKIKGRVGKSIKESEDSIKLSKTLAKINFDLPIKFDIESMAFSEFEDSKLLNFLKHFELKSIIKKLFKENEEITLNFNIGSKNEFKIDPKFENFLKSDLPNDDFVYLFFEDGKILFEDGKKCEIKDFKENIADKKICSFDIKNLIKECYKSDIVFDFDFFDVALASYVLNPSDNFHDFMKSFYFLTGYEDLIEEDIIKQFRFVMLRKMKYIAEKRLSLISSKDVFLNIEEPLLKVLADMENTGIKCDRAVLDNADSVLTSKLNSLEDEIYNISMEKFNINSPKQLSYILYEKLMLPNLKKNATDILTLNELRGYPIIPLIIEYRESKKLQSSYTKKLPSMIERDGMIRTHFDSMKTETGRLASSEPNLQNIPAKSDLGREIRKSFVVRNSESIFMSADYSQIELRVIAHYADDKKMCEAFSKDFDIHAMTASEIFNVKLSEVTELMRKKAKAVNFGIIYGISAHGLSRSLNIPMSEAKNYIDMYFHRFPQIDNFIKETIKQTEKDGFVTTLLGRRRYIENINSRTETLRASAGRIAVNTIIQGSAADIMKSAMIKISENIKNMGLKSKMLLQIHDELVFEVPLKEAEELESM
ncbi:DNA polymerase I, partial [bacterium]|nr:DNA polymerase I [bacterium]